MQIQFFDPRKNCIWLFFRFLRFCKLSSFPRPLEPSKTENHFVQLSRRDLGLCGPSDRRIIGSAGGVPRDSCGSSVRRGVADGGLVDGVARVGEGDSTSSGCHAIRTARRSREAPCRRVVAVAGRVVRPVHRADASCGASVPRSDGRAGREPRPVRHAVVSTRRSLRRPNRTNKKKGVTICLHQTDSS